MIYKLDKKYILEEFTAGEALSQAGNEMEDDAVSTITNNAGKIAAGIGTLGAGALVLKNSAVNSAKHESEQRQARMNKPNMTRVKGSTTVFSH